MLPLPGDSSRSATTGHSFHDPEHRRHAERSLVTFQRVG
jgi:hypothetical protein